MTRLRNAGAYLGLGWRVLLHRLGSTRPFKITLALTDRCDCRCQGCFIWKKPKGREMTPAEIHDVLVAAPSLRWVNLTGGEPFLREDLPDVVRAVTRALPRLAVLDFPTTGQRTERIVSDVAEIASLGIPRVYVTVSVEGPAALHDRLRGRDGAFERMVATYARLRRQPGVRVFLGMTLSDANADQVAPTLEAVAAHLPRGERAPTLRDLHLNVFTTSDHYYANAASALRPPRELETTLREALRVRERGGDPGDRIEAIYMRLVPEHLRTGHSPLRCRSTSASVFVSPGGDLLPCTVWSRRLGNVLERPLYELLDTARAAETRRLVSRSQCPGCWSPCEASPTIVASLPESLMRRGARR